MQSQSLDDSLTAYYESLKTPVLFFLDDKIEWHNSAAEHIFQNRAFCAYFMRYKIPINDQMVKVELTEQSYYVMLRPWMRGMLIEVMDVSVIGSICAEQFTLESAVAMDHIVRNNTHRIFHSVDALRPILETQEKYEELAYLDIIFESTYQMLRAADVYKEYMNLFHHPSNIVSVDVMQELEAVFSAAKVILQHSTTPFRWVLSQPQLNCRIDIHRLGFAVLHLIANAFHFTAPGNEVRVEVSVAKGDFLKVCVFDKGVGFGPDGVQRALQPFYSYDPNTGDVVGYGLGLTYAHAYAKQCGGSCTITSSNHQTAVMLTIPYYPLPMGSLCSPKTQFSLGKFSKAAIVLSSVVHVPWT